MTERRPGAWPAGLRPVPTSPTPASPPEAARTPVPVPDVHLVVTVDLTGRFSDARQVSDALWEQSRRAVDCDTVIVRLGPDALRHGMGLGQSIAGRFYLSARRIEVHVPAGDRLGPLLQAEVARYVRLYCADHAAATGHSGTAG
ncbi:hypothetical protein ACS0VI_26020 [Streptomyces sp. H28]|uniref:hypothetical protein n=1 Tax=Streptomyces sp. H28 TaxID=2775865 RepID=UPI003EC85DDB